MPEYNHKSRDNKWQKKWLASRTYSPDLKEAKDPFSNLMMFPYPSAEGLHVGNMYAFTGADVYGRFNRMLGKDVFQPIGLDGFGIHSENYAIKVGKHPKEHSQESERNYYRQLHEIGNAYDWSHTLETYDPDYYRWTQWLFIKMFKAGLAYKGSAMVNWCPSCKTVLADEQVINGKCERCGSEVGRRSVSSWFFRITKYADRLLNNLSKIDWPRKIKLAQEQWIGKSEGAIVDWKIKGAKENVSISTFTTRLDTIFGVTFLVLAPEHEAIDNYFQGSREVREFVNASLAKTEQDRKIGKEGVFTGYWAIHPLTGEEIPIWVGEFVLKDYGTGAVMGVPSWDERDLEFAKEHKLQIKKVKLAKKEDLQPLFDKKMASKHTSYHLRDWLISRQRYWGPPIPMIYCDSCAAKGEGERRDLPGWYTVPEKDLPVELPYIKNFQPIGTGEAPLKNAPEAWRNVACPTCGEKAERELEVSDTFLDSSWYFLAYPNLGTSEWKGNKQPFNKDITEKWLPVNKYIGGAEHAVLHLLYSRFTTMVLYDGGYLPFEEPFPSFYAHGLIISEGAKMSKSRGNVVIPDEYIKKYGADTLRTYLMFLGPFDQGGDFRDTGIEGMHRFIRRVWKLFSDYNNIVLVEEKDSRDVLVKMHQTIKKVTEDIQGFRYNTAISAIMEFVNLLYDKTQGDLKSAKGKIRCAEWDDALRSLCLLLAPFSPYITEEIWVEVLGKNFSVHKASWPKFDPDLIKEKDAIVVIQVDGKLRSQLTVDSRESTIQQVVEKIARGDPKMEKWLTGVKIKKVVFVPGKIINFVTSS